MFIVLQTRGCYKWQKKCPNQSVPFLSFLFWYNTFFLFLIFLRLFFSFWLNQTEHLGLLGCKYVLFGPANIYRPSWWASPRRPDAIPHPKLIIIALEARPLPCPDDGPAGRKCWRSASCPAEPPAGDRNAPKPSRWPTVEEREVAGVPTSRLPPVKFDFLPYSGAHPLESLRRECLCSSCVVQSKHCVEIRTHRPNQPKENLVVKHLFPPVNNNISQSIAQHCFIYGNSGTHDATLADT